MIGDVAATMADVDPDFFFFRLGFRIFVVH
jgi:hypothetical protein